MALKSEPIEVLPSSPIEIVVSFGGGSGGGGGDYTILAARVTALENQNLDARVTALEEGGGNSYNNPNFPQLDTYDKALDYVLDKGTAPQVTLAFSPAQTSPVEVGTTISKPTLAWTANKSMTLTLTDGGTIDASTDRSGSKEINKDYTNNNYKEQSWTLEGTDAAGQKNSATVKINWMHRIYSGPSADAETYDATFITTLSNSLKAVNGTYSVTLASGQNFFIAIPTTSTINKVTIDGFEYSKVLKASAVSITNAQNLTVQYNLYQIPTDAKGSISFVIS